MLLFCFCVGVSYCFLLCLLILLILVSFSGIQGKTEVFLLKSGFGGELLASEVGNRAKFPHLECSLVRHLLEACGWLAVDKSCEATNWVRRMGPLERNLFCFRVELRGRYG